MRIIFLGKISTGELCISEKIRQSWNNAMLCVCEHTHWYVTICKRNPPSIIFKVLINKSKLHLYFIFLLCSGLKAATASVWFSREQRRTGEGEIIKCIHFTVFRDRVPWLFYCLGCPILLNYLPGHHCDISIQR